MLTIKPKKAIIRELQSPRCNPPCDVDAYALPQLMEDPEEGGFNDVDLGIMTGYMQFT